MERKGFEGGGFEEKVEIGVCERGRKEGKGGLRRCVFGTYMLDRSVLGGTSLLSFATDS